MCKSRTCHCGRVRLHVRIMSYVTDTFASCLTHPFPSEGDIACENDSSNLYVNPLDGSGGGGGGGGGGGVNADFNGVRRSASGDGSVLCAKGSQGEGSPRGSRASLAGAAAAPAPSTVVGARPLDASRASLPQPLDEPPSDDAKPKHRKARFQQVSDGDWRPAAPLTDNAQLLTNGSIVCPNVLVFPTLSVVVFAWCRLFD